MTTREVSGLKLAAAWLLVPVLAAGIWLFLARAPDAAPENVNADPGAIEGVTDVVAVAAVGSQPVVGTPVVRDTLHLQVVAAGLAQASRVSRVAARTSGLVQQVFVREGQSVNEGDLLVQLDTVEAAMNLVRARATLARAEAQYRERMLGGRGILPPEVEEARERIVRAETGLTTAEVDLAERELELELTRVRAPFSGRVADVRAVEGAFLGQGSEVLTLMQMDPVQVSVEVMENDVATVAPGHRARVRFNSLAGETRTATVESINPLVDPATRAARVTLALPNPGGRILPGSYAWVTLDTEALGDRTVIPREAVLTRGDRRDEVVFVLAEVDADGRGVAEMRHVALGLRNDTHVEVVPSQATAMLEPGEVVLIDGHHFLAVGTLVHLVQTPEGAARGGGP